MTDGPIENKFIYMKVQSRVIGQEQLCPKTDRQTDRPTDRQTDRQTDRPTDRQTDRQT